MEEAYLHRLILDVRQRVITQSMDISLPLKTEPCVSMTALVLSASQAALQTSQAS